MAAKRPEGRRLAPNGGNEDFTLDVPSGAEHSFAVLMIRLALNTDIDRILAIDPAAKPKLAFVQAAVDKGECFLATEDDTLVGYGVIDYAFFGRAFVHLIHVDTAHRRLGVASRLFREFEERCKSPRIFTSTNLSNLPMHKFLTSRGYVLSGVVQHLDEGDPEVFYSKALSV
jgi:GNAT superfamily N-acetyltransferase